MLDLSGATGLKPQGAQPGLHHRFDPDPPLHLALYAADSVGSV